MLISEKIAILLFVCAVGAVYLLEAAVIVRVVQARLQGKKTRKLLCSRSAITIHAFAVLGLGCFFYGRFIEPGWIEVNSFEIQTPKLQKTRFRIVHISDLHCEKEPLNEEEIVPLINSMGESRLLRRDRFSAAGTRQHCARKGWRKAARIGLEV